MSKRTKKYSEHDISAMLDSNSDSDMPGDTTRDMSDSEVMFDSIEKMLLKRNMERKAQAQMKIKLRRSTEQSMYKIDSDSDCEKPKSKFHKNQNRLKENDVSAAKGHEVPRRTSRARKPPIRFSDYSEVLQVQSPARVDSPNLRSRKPVNYTEDYPLPNSDKSHVKPKNKRVKGSVDLNASDQDLEEIVSKSEVAAEEPNHTNSGLNLNATPKSHKIHNAVAPQGIEKDMPPKTIKTRLQNNVCKPNTRNEIDDTLNSTNLPKAKSKNTHAGRSSSVNSKVQSRIQKTEKTVLTSKENELNITNNDIAPDAEVTDSTAKTLEKPFSTAKSQKAFSAEESVESPSSSLNTPKSRKPIKHLTPSRRKRTSTLLKPVVPLQNEFIGEKNVESPSSNLNTPKSHKAIKHLTPSIGKRTSTLLKPVTPLQEARSRLHVSAVPKSLPCREEEFNNIFTFLEGKLTDHSAGCIYISGVPGTGKTATINEVIRCLKRSVAKGNLENFDCIEINGMKLSEPRQAYVQIYKQLSGKLCTWEQAYEALEKEFSKKKFTGKMTLLLVDELDLLCTKRQDVVYNLLDWPTRASARLIVITIANTMDLPERVLMGRVTSRLGLTRLTFHPYNHKQLQEIVLTRLKDTESFRSEAIQLVARKVAAVSGDARRALDICRRATEITESRDGQTVSMDDVNQALSEMIATAKVQAIKCCSKIEQMFLQAVCAEIARTGVEETCFKNVYQQLESLTSFDGLKVPTVTEALAVCARLSASKLLICEHFRTDLYQRIFLNVSTDDIHYALQKMDIS